MTAETLTRTIEAEDAMHAEREAEAACREFFGETRHNWRVAMTSNPTGGVICELTAEAVE